MPPLNSRSPGPKATQLKTIMKIKGIDNPAIPCKFDNHQVSRYSLKPVSIKPTTMPVLKNKSTLEKTIHLGARSKDSASALRIANMPAALGNRSTKPN